MSAVQRYHLATALLHNHASTQRLHCVLACGNIYVLRSAISATYLVYLQYVNKYILNVYLKYINNS